MDYTPFSRFDRMMRSREPPGRRADCYDDGVPTRKRGATGGEIVVDVEVEDPGDRDYFERGHGKEADIRRESMKAVVDTGAVIPMLPQEVVERLGVSARSTLTVTYADERREERPVAGPFTMRLCNRFMSVDCVVRPPFSEPLIGQIVLEALN